MRKVFSIKEISQTRPDISSSGVSSREVKGLLLGCPLAEFASSGEAWPFRSAEVGY